MTNSNAIDESIRNNYAIRAYFEKNIDTIIKAAESGDPIAMYCYSRWLCAECVEEPHTGRIPHDMAKSWEWLHKSAEAGFPRAMFDIGQAYKRNDWFAYVQRDLKQAKHWLEKAKAHGEAAADYALFELDDILFQPKEHPAWEDTKDIGKILYKRFPIIDPFDLESEELLEKIEESELSYLLKEPYPQNRDELFYDIKSGWNWCKRNIE